MATLTAGPSGINMSLSSFFVPIIDVNSFTSSTITDTIQNGNTEVWTGYFIYGNGQLIGKYPA